MTFLSSDAASGIGKASGAAIADENVHGVGTGIGSFAGLTAESSSSQSTFDSWSELSPNGGMHSSVDSHSAIAHSPIVAVGSTGHFSEA